MRIVIDSGSCESWGGGRLTYRLPESLFLPATATVMLESYGFVVQDERLRIGWVHVVSPLVENTNCCQRYFRLLGTLPLDANSSFTPFAVSVAQRSVTCIKLEFVHATGTLLDFSPSDSFWCCLLFHC